MYAENHHRFFFGISFTALLSSFYVGYAVAVLNPLQDEIVPNNQEFLTFTGLVPFGGIIGTLVWKKWINQRGRLFFIILGNILGSIGCALSVVIFNIPVFVIGRLLCGFSWGIFSLAVPFYMKEIIPAELAANYLAFFQLGIILGNVAPVFFAPQFQLYITWQGIMCFPILTNVIQLILFGWYYRFDTPTFYMMKQDQRQALLVLNKVYSPQLLEQISNYDMDEHWGNAGIADLSIQEVMRKDHSKRVLITSTSLAFFVPMTSIFAIVFYYGFLMRHVVTYSPYFTVYFTASFALLACVSALLVHERYGRKQMLKPGWIGMFIANLLIGFGWLYNNVLAFWGIVLYLASYNFSVGTLKWVYIAEVSNINMAAISYFAYWLSCTLIAGILPWTKDDNIYLAFFFFALCSLIWLVTVYFLKETNLPVPDECSREWFDESFLNNRQKMYTKNYKSFFVGITITANLSALVVGYQLTLLNAMNYLNERGMEFSLYMWLFAFGSWLGVFACRIWANSRGRYFFIVVGNVLGSIGSALSFFRNQQYVFSAGRIVAGFSVGIVPISSLFYIKEIVPSGYSSRYLSSYQLWLISGEIIPFWIAPNFDERISAYILASLPILINAVQIYLLVFVYNFDTPVYYTQKKEHRRARSVLEKIYEPNFIKELEVYDIQSQDSKMTEVVGVEERPRSSIIGIVQPRRLLISSWILSFFIVFTGIYMFIFYYTLVMEQFHIFSSRLTLYIPLAVSWLSALMAYIFIDYFGRKQILKLGWIGMTFSNIAGGFSIVYDSNLLSFIMINIYVLWFQCSLGTIKWVYITEAWSIKNACNIYLSYAGSIFIFTIIFPFFLSKIDFIIFFIFAISSAICFVVTYFMNEINYKAPVEQEKDWFDSVFLM